MDASIGATLHVVILAGAADTVHGLSEYFKRVGVATDAMSIPPRVDTLPESATAVVMFPDDLNAADVDACIAGLRTARPGVLLVLVTSTPQEFGNERNGRVSTTTVVLPRPAFGWVILDAIRSGVGQDPA